MTRPLSSKDLPQQLEELIIGYILGHLSPEEAEEFGRLLAENPQLVTQVNLWQEALEFLPYALCEGETPLHLRSAILNAAWANINCRPVRRWCRLP